MKRSPFAPEEIPIVRRAIEISEELISDHYKISTSDWKRYRYDVQSLADLQPDEITDHAFAQIRRYARHPDHRLRGGEPGDYFKICLQDHIIRKAIDTDPRVRLLPLTIYIVVHELIHIVRFARFLQSFHATESERISEESRVHALTHDLLKNRKLEDLPAVLEAFAGEQRIERLLD
jgi:hypothetical protein